MTESKNSPSAKYEVGQIVKYKLPDGGVADMEIISYNDKMDFYVLYGREKRVSVPRNLMPLRLVTPEEENFKYSVGSKVIIPSSVDEYGGLAKPGKKSEGYVYGKTNKGEYIILCPDNSQERKKVFVAEAVLDEYNLAEGWGQVIDIRAGIHDDLKRSE